MLLKFPAGRLILLDVRCVLKLFQEAYPDIRWLESKGWITHNFYILGNEKVLHEIGKVIKKEFGGYDENDKEL